jgi:hypothetical protein
MAKNNDTVSVLIWIPIIYLIISQIFAIIFMIDYIKDDDTSVLEAIFFSAFVGEFKGLFWVFFI